LEEIIKQLSNIVIQNSLFDSLTQELKDKLSTIVDFDELEGKDNDVCEEMKTKDNSEPLDS
jgi:hypothetical protein